MDIRQLRALVQEHGSVVLVEEGHQPLIVRPLRAVEEPPQEVPIAARWPKSRPHGVASDAPASRQDAVLERLNKEILALREQIAQEEAQAEGSRG
ncbi:MAG: hypothetical protein IT406_00425 [Candidatus Yanofskybacteria bacterium]|nr:hypothetical protein [Candidatus Yanofskybacteria bacterium]